MIIPGGIGQIENIVISTITHSHTNKITQTQTHRHTKSTSLKTPDFDLELRQCVVKMHTTIYVVALVCMYV